MKHKRITEIKMPFSIDYATGYVAIGEQFRSRINPNMVYKQIHRSADGEQYIWYNRTTWYL